ncbi:MAG: hypothetical protein JSR77_13650 [Planctomycetes bacterium]|nr:hypothetical protein [Planctomycetota bacterium]
MEKSQGVVSNRFSWVTWLLGGLGLVIAAVVLIGIGMRLGWRIAARESAASDGASRTVPNLINHSSAQEPAAPVVGRPSRAEINELSELVAAPLIGENELGARVSEAELFAAIMDGVSRAKAIADRGGELAPIATEAGDAFNELHTILKTAPSSQALLRAGLDAWRGGIENDGTAFTLGIIGVGIETSKLSETDEKISKVHSRIVSCRYRLAEYLMEIKAPATGALPLQAAFQEAREFGKVANDTLTMTNASGQPLTGVIVVVGLTGKSGERFINLFYRARWEANQPLQAICLSKEAWRETVHNVQVVNFRVIANERTSDPLEIRMTQ